MKSTLFAGLMIGAILTRGVSQSAPEQTKSEQPLLHAEFERPGLPTPFWALDLRPDGSGMYHATAVTPAGEEKIDRAITVQPETAKKIFGFVDASKEMKPCEAPIKHLANMGRKMVRYARLNGSIECTFNYTENKGLVSAMQLLQGVALTLEEGRKLDHLRRFDRLGVDAEMQTLQRAAKSGQAVDLSAIAETLRGLAQDESLMERVRTMAVKMLQDSGAMSDS